MNPTLEFENTFDPSQNRRKGRKCGRRHLLSEKMLAELRVRPGIWARVHGKYAKGRSAVQSTVTRLRKNPDFIGYEFSTERRGTQTFLMARFVGEIESQQQKAPQQKAPQQSGTRKRGYRTANGLRW